MDLTKLLEKINDTPEHKHRYERVCKYNEHENVYDLAIYDKKLPFGDCKDKEDYAHIGITISEHGEVLDWYAHSDNKNDEIKISKDLLG